MRNGADQARIRAMEDVPAPLQVLRALPASVRTLRTVNDARLRMQEILRGDDQRLLVIVGPCSIHDPSAAMEYAERLSRERLRLADDLEICMRTYFEKPRTSVGWKGLINDPDLDDSCQIGRGLSLARGILLQIGELGLPAACEFLDLISPNYIADLISWGAIGARTTESQLHRELASGLPCPIGFKNGTDGNIMIAIAAIKAAHRAHRFLSVDENGRLAIVTSSGNPDGHLILRGGTVPNYDAASVAQACADLVKAGLSPRLLIDASHGNVHKQPERQNSVCHAIAEQISANNRHIVGVMVESQLVAGRQELGDPRRLVYGQSITDSCLGWNDTLIVLNQLAMATRHRRTGLQARRVCGIASPADTN